MNALSDLNPVSRWLDVLGSIDHNISTLPMNVTFADVTCDSDFKLVIGDFGSINNIPKLKIFKGASMIHEIILPDMPSSVTSFFTNESLPRNPPAVAVSMCSTVYIYKNMKLFYKFYLPLLEVSSLELEIWRKFNDVHMQDDESLIKLVERLNEIPFSSLTPQSQHLLTLSHEKYFGFIKQNSEMPVQKSSTITCMCTLNMNSIEKEGVACLILGTENGDVIILDPQTFTILCQARVCNMKATPSHIEASGLFDVEYRIIIATREGSICLLRREWLEGKCLVQLSSLVVGLLIMPGDSSIITTTMDKNLHCFSKKGKKSWSLTLPQSVSTIALVQLAHLGINLIAIAMVGGLIQFYNGKNLVDSITTQDTISVIRFGQLGQEENVLVLITIDGALMLKILKRTADFNSSTMNNIQKSHPSYLAAQQARPLLVPKKSKLFLEQTAREREQSIAMHETFQKELCQLRLYVAKATVESIQNANNSLNVGSSEPLKLSARVPMLVPGMPYTYMSNVTEMFVPNQDTMVPESSDVNEDVQPNRPPLRVILIKDGQSQPLLAASIYIPPTDPLMMPFY